MSKKSALRLSGTALQSHFGVYALILSKSRNECLLTKKALGCYTGLYDLPGGTMEPDELLEQTLHREVLEETGCMIVESQQLTTLSTLFPFKKSGENFVLRHIGTIYTATVSGTPRTTSDGTDDSLGCIWVPLRDVSDKNSAPFVIDAVKFVS